MAQKKEILTLAVQLGAQLLQAKEVKDFPRMLKEINHQQWQDFFVREAKRLGEEVFRPK